MESAEIVTETAVATSEQLEQIIEQLRILTAVNGLLFDLLLLIISGLIIYVICKLVSRLFII